jgi:FKBP-type peptidyl-prolyl cis-trans isomerase SlyD
MIAEKNKVVSLSYVLRRADTAEKEIVEEVFADRPLTFLLGHGNLLSKFEANVEGLKVGDSFEFILACDDAYGKSQPEAVVVLPKNIFEIDGVVDETMLTVGNAIPMMDNAGNRLNGVVVELGDDTVKMDFNHPMAGADLHFVGKVVDIREATEEELQHGHIHQGGGCGSGSCGDCGCGEGAEEASCGCGSESCGCN